jgi:hypothetical protein
MYICFKFSLGSFYIYPEQTYANCKERYARIEKQDDTMAFLIYGPADDNGKRQGDDCELLFVAARTGKVLKGTSLK